MQIGPKIFKLKLFKYVDVYTTAFSSARLISEAFRSFQCSGRRECKTEFDAYVKI